MFDFSEILILNSLLLIIIIFRREFFFIHRVDKNWRNFWYNNVKPVWKYFIWLVSRQFWDKNDWEIISNHAFHQLKSTLVSSQFFFDWVSCTMYIHCGNQSVTFFPRGEKKCLPQQTFAINEKKMRLFEKEKLVFFVRVFPVWNGVIYTEYVSYLKPVWHSEKGLNYSIDSLKITMCFYWNNIQRQI